MSQCLCTPCVAVHVCGCCVLYLHATMLSLLIQMVLEEMMHTKEDASEKKNLFK